MILVVVGVLKQGTLEYIVGEFDGPFGAFKRHGCHIIVIVGFFVTTTRRRRVVGTNATAVGTTRSTFEPAIGGNRCSETTAFLENPGKELLSLER